MATSTLRSTAAITNFVTLTDESRTIALRLKQIAAELALLQPEVFEQIGDRRSVMVGKQVRTLERSTTEKIVRTCDDQTAVDYCKDNGLNYHERSAEYVAPAAFTSYVKKGLMSADLFEIESTPIIVVT